jgi:hypothetical protein
MSFVHGWILPVMAGQSLEAWTVFTHELINRASVLASRRKNTRIPGNQQHRTKSASSSLPGRHAAPWCAPLE